MRIALLTLAVLLLGCYDDFWNPKTCTLIAERDGFILNGEWVTNSENTIKIMAIHKETGVTGRLVFNKTEWYEGEKRRKHISYFFEALNKEDKEKYRLHLIGIKDKAEITPEDIKEEAPRTSGRGWMEREL